MDDFLKYDDTFLARWVAGELSAEELKQFEQHPDFNYYIQLIEKTGEFQIEKVDSTRLLRQIKSKRSIKTAAPVKKLNRRYILMATATLLILIIGYQVFFKTQTTNIETSFGVQIAETLPDGSSFNLNAHSKLQYDKDGFIDDRILTLEGEAFFEVKEGRSFIVKTKSGTVEVLGTSFTVYSKDGVLKVACKTGKVKVTNQKGDNTILSPGERVFSIDGKMKNKENIQISSIASWKNGTSLFVSEPLWLVAKSLEDHYGIKIQLNSNQNEELFSGGFVHNDLDEALRSVFAPMGLKYSEKQKGNYIIE